MSSVKLTTFPFTLTKLKDNCTERTTRLQSGHQARYSFTPATPVALICSSNIKELQDNTENVSQICD